MIHADLRLTLDVPQEIRVVSARVTEGLSTLTHAEIEISSDLPIELDGVLEQPAIINFKLGDFASRMWSLRVGHIDFLRIVDSTLRYRANLYPDLWLMRFTTNTRKFRKMSSEDIIGKVLDECNVRHRFELTRTTETRNYCAQYRETNLDFVLRLMEFEGIYYAFEPDGTLVMADRSQDSKPTEVLSTFELLEGTEALQWETPGIYEFRKERHVASGAATVNDFNWKKPKVDLLSSSAADEDAELEIYDYPTGYRRPDQGARLAQTRLEALRVPSRNVAGGGNVVTFEPGRTFVFGTAAGARFAGEYLLQSVEHHYHDNRFKEAALFGERSIFRRPVGTRDNRQVGYRNTFHAIPKETPFRAALLTTHPHITGCHTAMVRGPEGEETHTDKYGRFRAQFHWDREAKGTDEDSRWLRALQETQSGVVLARVGWEYSIAYIDGDPDRPFGFARDINGVMRPEYAQPTNKTMMSIKTPSYPNDGTYNELRLEDKAGSQFFDWFAEKDLVMEVNNNRVQNVGGNEQATVGVTKSHRVGNDQDVTIGGNYTVTVGENIAGSISGNRTYSVGSNEELKVEEVFAESTMGNETETVAGNRKSECGEERGNHSRAITKSMKRTVTGSSTSKGKGDIGLEVQKLFVEDIGGSKITRVANGGMSGGVTGPLDATVTGLVVRMSDEAMGFGAENAQFDITGAAIFKSEEQMTVNGDHIVLEATADFTLKSGVTEIAMTAGSMAFKGKVRLKSGNIIKVAGNPDNLTK